MNTLYRLQGGCQVGPRFPVLALFTNRNVFHLPPPLHLHLFIHPVVQRHPLTPLPLKCFLVDELYIIMHSKKLFISSAFESPFPLILPVLLPGARLFIFAGIQFAVMGIDCIDFYIWIFCRSLSLHRNYSYISLVLSTTCTCFWYERQHGGSNTC